MRDLINLVENFAMVPVTPELTQKVRAMANNIAADIAADLPEDDEEFAEMLRAKLREIDAIGGIGERMGIARAELRPLDHIPNGLTSVGCHWSWHLGSAKVYHHQTGEEEHEGEELVDITIEAEVSLHDIDWVFTLATNLILPGEREITVRQGATVKITHVWDEDGMQHPAGYTEVTSGYYDDF
jgi:hypothetical protein